MQQPQGFESPDKSLVCKLNWALYGLKQAPRAWYERLTQALLKFGFRAIRCDPYLFIISNHGVTLYALVYVDEILITGSCSKLITALIDKLNATFSLKQLGRPDYFLGIEVKYLPNGSMLLTQSKSIRDLLHRANMLDCKGISTPMVSDNKPSRHGTDTLSDPHHFRSIVGALQYITLTRRELSYSVHKVCQFLSTPLDSHWRAVKRILHYLKGTSHFGLLLQPALPDTTLTLWAYSDSDWNNDPDDRRSTSGSYIFVGPNLVSWSSKKQSLVARSSAEAVYRGMLHTTSELLWL